MSLFDLLFKKEKPSKGKYEKTINDLLKRINNALKKGDYFRAGWLYHLSAKVAGKAGDYDKAIQYALQAADYHLKVKRYFNVGWNYKYAALYAKEAKDLDKAIEYALKASEYFLKDNNIYATSWSYNFAAQACKAKKDLYSAIRYYRKSLELQEDEEIKNEIERLKKLIPHITVAQYVSVCEPKEGEEVGIKMVIENMSNEPIKNIEILGKDVENINISRLMPGDAKVFNYTIRAVTGWLPSKYNLVKWKTLTGDEFENKIKGLEIWIKPNIQINSYMPELVLNKQAELVILLKNLSTSKITDVKLNIQFPAELEVIAQTPLNFNRILAGGEKGVVWQIRPRIVGRIVIDKGWVEFKSEYGKSYKENIEPIVGEILKTSKPTTERELKKEELEEKKDYRETFITKYPLSESQYVELTKKFQTQQKGCTLRGIDLDTASKHVLEECSAMTLVSEHEFTDERLFLFSCKSLNTDARYLFTIVIKKENDLVNIAFKAYSDKGEYLEDFINDVMNIVKYTILTSTLAREVEHIEIKKVVNIIDSIVQRSKIATDEGLVKEKKFKIKDSVVQRSEI